MIPFAIPAAALKWWELAAGCVLGALMCFPLAQCHGEHIGAQRAALALERANRAALEQKARADELAANQRLTDTIAVNRQEEALRHAIESTPDSAPDAVRQRLNCERLRRANPGNPSAVPAVCRSSGGAQAGPAR